MPTIVTGRPYRPVPTDPPRKRWTRAESHAVDASGVWMLERLELIEGELIDKRRNGRPGMEKPLKLFTRRDCAAIKAVGMWDRQRLELVNGELIGRMERLRPQTNAAIVVQNWLVQVFGVQHVKAETPIDVAPADNPANEPQPDLVVLARPSWAFRFANPEPIDLIFVVEISEATLGFDLTTRADLYARAGISGYWFFDVAARKLVVHQGPVRGLYQSVVVYDDHESVSAMVTGPDLRVGDAFPE